MQQPPDWSPCFNVAPFSLLVIELPVILLKRKLDNLSPLNSPMVTQSKQSSLYNSHQSPELSGLCFLPSPQPYWPACCSLNIASPAFVLAVLLSSNHHICSFCFGYHSSQITSVLTGNSPFKVGNLKSILQIYEQGVGKALGLVPQRTRGEVRGLIPGFGHGKSV